MNLQSDPVVMYEKRAKETCSTAPDTNALSLKQKRGIRERAGEGSISFNKIIFSTSQTLLCPQATAFHFMNLFCQLLVTCTVDVDLILLNSKSLKCSKGCEQAHNDIQVTTSRHSEQL